MLLYPAMVLFRDIPCSHQWKQPSGTTGASANALQAAVSMLMEKNLDIPAPGKARVRNAVLVALPSVVASAKAELYIALRSAGVRKTELARRMGIHKQQVERLLDIDHASRIEQLESAFAVLNMRMVLEIRDAA